MKLERFFSMLAPTGLNFACFSLRKARIEAFLHMLGLQVYFLFVPSLLPTVMDPSSVIIRVFSFFFLFVPFTIHFSYCHANLDICPRGVDSRLIFSFPL